MLEAAQVMPSLRCHRRAMLGPLRHLTQIWAPEPEWPTHRVWAAEPRSTGEPEVRLIHCSLKVRDLRGC
jgi:hypothetical protein